MKLEKVGDGESKIWFRSIRVATKHLDEVVGKRHWKWCKICEASDEISPARSWTRA